MRILASGGTICHTCRIGVFYGQSYVYPTTKESSYPTDAIAEVQSEILGDRFMTFRGRNIIIAASVLMSLI